MSGNATKWRGPAREDTMGPPLPRFLAEGRGNCAGYPSPDDFTEEGISRKDAATRRRAQRVCAGCPFKYPCANWAMEHNQEGVYGGTTTAERRRERARDNQA